MSEPIILWSARKKPYRIEEPTPIEVLRRAEKSFVVLNHRGKEETRHMENPFDAYYESREAAIDAQIDYFKRTREHASDAIKHATDAISALMEMKQQGA